MMKHRNDIFCKILIGASLMLGACSDDLKYDNGINDEGGLIICIPDVESAAYFGATRTDGFANTRALDETDEGNINSLWLCAFPAEGSDVSPVVKNLLTSKDVLPITGANGHYTKSYKVQNFEEGDYHFYLLANIEDYLIEDDKDKFTDGTLSQENVKELILHFAASHFSGTNALTAGNLPMGALDTEMKSSPTGTPLENGVFSLSMDNNKLYADLTFLCSKVRYTILFNSKSGGVSSAFTTDLFNLTGGTVTNLRGRTALTSEGNGSPTLFITTIGNESGNNQPFVLTLAPGKFKYPEQGDTYPNYGDGSTGNSNLRNTFDDDSDDKSQIAWQQVFYIPENITETDDEKTQLNFMGDITTNDGTLLETRVFDPINIEYAPKNNGTDNSGNATASSKANNGNHRGAIYDIVARVSTPADHFLTTSVSVSDWTLTQLSYQLMGPVELIVESTEISVTSGVETKMSISSNVFIDFDFPKITYGNKEYPFYVVRKESEDSDIYVFSVNPAIPYSALSALKDDDNNESHHDDPAYKSHYAYFHVVAGNLNKKIKVTPLALDPYLIVNPDEIFINVREYYVSGKYDGFKEISYETNVEQGIEIIELEGYDSEDEITYSKGLLEGISGTKRDKLVTLSGLSASEANMSGKLVINFDGFNDGEAYWNREHDYKLLIKVKDDTPAIQAQAAPVIVKIHIRPYGTNYIIHFKCNDVNQYWEAPHIYVYQCLDLPRNLPNGYSDRNGITVGYPLLDGDNKELDEYNASLEYLFTSGIAFKGWNGYGANTKCEPTAPGNFKKGFFVFDDPTLYRPMNGKGEYLYEQMTDSYNTGLQFNSDHIQSAGVLQCSECQNGNVNPWPGIMMEPEGNGWWKYTLTDIATPGKALIMFADRHLGSNYRYPGNNVVGEALFDFPGNEGWFLYNGRTEDRSNNFFRDSKPKSNTVSDNIRTYRVYWHKDLGNGMYFKIGSKEIAGWQDNSPCYVDPKNSDFRYYEFKVPVGSSSYNAISYKLWDAGAGDNKSGSLSSFIDKNNDGIYCAYLTGTWEDLRPGEPWFVNGDKLTISWYHDYGDNPKCYYPYIYAQDNGFQPFGNWNGKRSGDSGRHTETVTFTGDHLKLSVELHNEWQENVYQPRLAYEIKPYSCLRTDNKNNGQGPTGSSVTFNPNTREYTVTIW